MKYDFDMVVIGGGAAGMVASSVGVISGAKTALIEKDKLGGDCTWYGCVPSKTLLKSARVFSLAQRLKDFGISAGGQNTCEPSGVMSHARDMAEKISKNHSPEKLEAKGKKIFFGTPEFSDAHTIQINGSRISAKRFILATGSHAVVPSIKGIQQSGYLTNKSIFGLESVPGSLVVLGGGPIGCELSSAFARLGTQVSIIERADRILPGEDKEAVMIIEEALQDRGVNIFTGCKPVLISNEDAEVGVTFEDKEGKRLSVRAEKLLVAAGRAPNTQGLNLEKAGVKYNDKGVIVDSALRTSAKHIYACGDIAGPYRFSHMSEYQAVTAAVNALFPFKRKVDYRAVPWCTFTDPDLARVGLTQEEAEALHKGIKVYRSFYSKNDMAIMGMETGGFSKVITDRKGYILGAHIVGSRAGDIIHEFVLAKSSGLKIGRISSAIHIYPTLAEVVKRSADQYYLELLDRKAIKGLRSVLLKFLR